jgi:hypothetical protein
MAKVPQPRKPGQTGGGGRIGQTSNRNKSSNRGGRPHAGGGGTGKKPPGSGCAVTAFIILAAPVGAVYGLVELFF